MLNLVPFTRIFICPAETMKSYFDFRTSKKASPCRTTFLFSLPNDSAYCKVLFELSQTMELSGRISLVLPPREFCTIVFWKKSTSCEYFQIAKEETASSASAAAIRQLINDRRCCGFV